MPSSDAKIRVLCVDDDPDIPAVLIRHIDRQSDMESVGALHTADELAAEARSRRADVVLLDLRMPGKDPLVAVRELSTAAGESSPITVIAFSGWMDKRSLDWAYDAGVWAYISKDSEISTVLLTVRAAARAAVGRRIDQ